MRREKIIVIFKILDKRRKLSNIFRRDSGEEIRNNCVTTKKSCLLSRNNFVGSRLSDENFTHIDYQFSEFNRSSWIEDEFLKLGLRPQDEITTEL